MSKISEEGAEVTTNAPISLKKKSKVEFQDLWQKFLRFHLFILRNICVFIVVNVYVCGPGACRGQRVSPPF